MWFVVITTVFHHDVLASIPAASSLFHFQWLGVHTLSWPINKALLCHRMLEANTEVKFRDKKLI